MTGDQFEFSGFVFQGTSTCLIKWAGMPPTTVYGATFFVTTEFAPTTAPSPMVTPGRITAPVPIQASGAMVIDPLWELTYGLLTCPDHR